MEKKVNVLLSSYNGEKYIQEQIESILHQAYKNIDIYVRDDGSEDKTVEILKRYEKAGKIKFIQGENIGFVRSFLSLLYECEQADYYAFSDQDDVWKEDKISVAVRRLEKYQNMPAVYCSNFTFCDKDLKIIGEGPVLPDQFTILKTVVNGQTGFGFTQVMNHKAREAITRKPMPVLGNVYGHDTWTHMVCLCFGKIIYDRESYAFCRRHGKNTSTQELKGNNILAHNMWRIKQFLVKDDGKKVYKDVKEFFETYSEELNDEQRKMIQLFLVPQHRMRKAFIKERYRENWIEEIAIRFLFLIGKM